MKKVEQFFQQFLFLIFVSLCFCCNSGNKAKRSSSEVAAQPTIRLDTRLNALAGRIFTSFTILNRLPVQSETLYNRPGVRVITESIKTRYSIAAKTCNTADCMADAMVIKKEELQSLVAEYENWRASNFSMNQKTSSRKSVGGGSGATPSFNASELETDLLAVNHIVKSYVGGAPLRYPKVDGGGFAKDDAGYLAKLKEKISATIALKSSENLFFALPMLVSLDILELNGRDEAARYEPLESGVNKPAFEQVSRTDFSKYQYSAIIVPGLGPSKTGISLDSGGARRCVLAATEYKKKKAPFIIVSGGHVHPDRTPFSEAIEMKKYLVEKLGIPANAVIAEPYARHTTTNVRNGIRIVYKFGMPANKPVMLVSDVFQSSYVMMMKGRFMEEIGFLPYKSLLRDDDRKPYFIPDSAALRRNPYDPLDP